MQQPKTLPVPESPSGLWTFDPYQDALGTTPALYGGAPWCPIDPDGNNLCICAEL